ncbi:MFS transporter [Corynebacterium sp. 21KM1197]|nr:MFS transporter [Corynebacterium sp. 21KM1197]WPF68769.1 MFS transporter [Corynebacterium sp. 21KM1197]
MNTVQGGKRGKHRRADGPVKAPKKWSTAVSTISAVMMTLDITIVLVALPAISEDLGLTLSGGQWVINAYSLAFASLMLSVGSISDLIGRRSIFLIGHVLFLGASIACMYADSETMLIAARAVQGAGGALVFGTSVPLLSDAFAPAEKAERTKAIATLMGLSAAASAVGPLVGGALVENGEWEWIFAINIPIGIFVLLATLLFIPDLHKQAREAGTTDMPPIDVPSTIIAAGMLFSLNYGIISGPERGWTDWLVILSFAAALQLGVILAWIQTAKGDNAMIDICLFRIPSFSTVAFSAFAARLFSFGMMPFIILWLSGHVGLSALEVGYVSTTLAGPIVIFSAVGLALGKVMRVSFVQALGMVIVAGGLLLGLMVQPDSSWPALVPSYVVIGIGTGIMLPHLMDLAVSVVPREKTGTASGIANTSLPLGTSFGVALYGAYLANHIEDGMEGAPEQIITATEGGRFDLVDQYAPQLGDLAREVFVEGLHGIFIMAAIFAVVGAVACLLFIREKDIRAVEEDSVISVTVGSESSLSPEAVVDAVAPVAPVAPAASPEPGTELVPRPATAPAVPMSAHPVGRAELAARARQRLNNSRGV